MYKVWHILDSFQDFSFLLFSTCSSLFFFVLAVKDFYNWGHYSQIVLWKIPTCSGPLTIKALGVDGNNYGAYEKRSLFNLLQALANMWSFFGCRFHEGDTCSLWYELGAEDANTKAPNACLFLRFGRAKVVMI